MPQEHAEICNRCEEPLDLEPGECPYDRDGELWCEDCYEEEYTFTCAWCDEYGDVDDQHRYLLIFEEELALPGVYLVQQLPYYTAPLLGGGWLHPWALKWLGAVPVGLEEDPWAPCGHLCRACQQRALQDIAVRQRLIHDVR